MRAMQDSGVEWIDRIPADWEVQNLKNFFSFGKGLPITKENLRESGVPVISYGQIHGKYNPGTRLINELFRYVDAEYLTSNPSALVHQGDFIFADTSEDVDGCGNCCYVDKEMQLFAGYHTVVLSAANRQDNSYLAYLFRTDAWRSQIRRELVEVKVYSISRKVLRKTTILLPPAAEQQRIAAYLDEQCSEIDKVLAKTRESIEEYKKLKQSVITEAVTKGIRPARPMKPSGIEWIGNIPEEWGMRRLRHLGCCQNGISKGAEFFDSGYPFVSYSDVYKNMELPHKVNGLVESTDEERERYSVLRGDIFFTRTSETIEEIGFTAVCLKTIPNATFAGFLIRVRPTTPLITPEFSKYYFRNDSHRCFFVKEMNLVTRASLGQELLKSLPVLLPPLDEQQEIATYLDRQCAEIDRLIAKKEQIITELEGYKKSLIYECVTGKREVAEKRDLVDIFGKAAKLTAKVAPLADLRAQQISAEAAALSAAKVNLDAIKNSMFGAADEARIQRILGDISRLTPVSPLPSIQELIPKFELPPIPPVPDSILQSTRWVSQMIEEQRKMFELPSFSQVPDSIRQSTRWVSEMIEEQRRILQPFQTDFKSIAQMLQSTAAWVGSLTSFATVHSRITKDWDAIWKTIHIPVKPEIQQKKRAAHKRWAEFGWSCHPNIEFSEIPPESAEVADKFMMQELENYGISKFIEELSQLVTPNRQKRFDDALFNFQHDRFVPCVMVMYALIEGEFIIRQPKEERSNGKPKNRHLAKGAAEVFVKELDESETAEKILDRIPRFFYRCENMFYAVITFFESANDFRDEDETVGLNRNFVDHGMSQRQAEKKHCLQLFLLYYNILSLFAFYDYIWPIKDELWLPLDKSDTDVADLGEEDSE